MTDNVTENEDDLKFDELAMLKQRADLLGVNYSNNIGAETLKQRIADKLAKDEEGATDSSVEDNQQGEPEEGETSSKKMSLFEYMKKEHLKLVRVRITNNNPQKINHPGEFFTVANKFVGTVRKYIPYDDKSEDGWHIPYILYKHLEDRKYLMIREVKNRQGETEMIQKYVKEFTLEVLPPLTPAEIAKIAQAQKALTD